MQHMQHWCSYPVYNVYGYTAFSNITTRVAVHCGNHLNTNDYCVMHTHAPYKQPMLIATREVG